MIMYIALTFICQVSIPISTEANEWTTAEVLRDEFTHADTLHTPSQLEDVPQATIELFARFLRFVAQNVDADSQRATILRKAVNQFTSSHLSQQDIHTVAATLDVDVRKTVLSSYFLALGTLEERKVAGMSYAPSPVLFTAPDASIYALFGGQGTNEVYFDELQSLYDTYTPYVASFLSEMTKVLLPLAASLESSTYYTHGLDVVSWLAGATPRPPTAYLASVPVSLPLIGLTQLTQYLVTCRAVRLSPGEMRKKLQGATGHSQGVVSAVVVAASTSFESYFEESRKGMKWLFYCGYRGQQAFPVLALEPSIVQDAVEGGEGSPSPMLLVAGLALKDLEKHVASTNKHLPENSQLRVSLHNAPRAFVVTGPARALYGLVTHLRKVRAPSGLDQSKIPFSQRKPVFSVRFLVVGVPYHSEYLRGMTEKMFEEDLASEELWTKEDLGMAVYHTETGAS